MFRVLATRVNKHTFQGRLLPTLSDAVRDGSVLPWTNGLPHSKEMRSRLLPPTRDAVRSQLYSTQATKAKYRSNSNLERATILENGQVLDVQWTDGVSSQFHSIWLRHNCHCPVCRHYSSNQRHIDVSTIPKGIKISDVNTSASGDIEITWQEDGHRGVVGQDFLRWYRYDDQALEDKYNSTEPLFLKEKHIPEMSYPEVKASEAGLYQWLKHISDFGICLLKDVPTTQNYMKKVVNLIGPIQETFYGEIFDVLYQPNAVNLAYDAVKLNFHMDQMPYESPPGIQFLHCLRFDESVKGGETLFVDMFHVAEQFRTEHPDKFKTFLEIPVMFERIHEERNMHMLAQRPHIELNKFNQIIGVSWHPSMEGPLQVHSNEVDRYYRAYGTFARMVVNCPRRKSIRLKPGEMICFNNRRMSHGRKSFQQTGDGVRHLQGAYVNIDHFRSLTQSLALKIGDGRLAPKVGNRSAM